MPKLKTKKSIKKRMWLTKNGKVRCFPAGTGHMQVAKTSKRRRRLRRSKILTGKIAVNMRNLIQS
ncbi:MAG: 50S ribosomal protein L35 [Planctomycetota bacterium]